MEVVLWRLLLDQSIATHPPRRIVLHIFFPIQENLDIVTNPPPVRLPRVYLSSSIILFSLPRTIIWCAERIVLLRGWLQCRDCKDIKIGTLPKNSNTITLKTLLKVMFYPKISNSISSSYLPFRVSYLQLVAIE